MRVAIGSDHAGFRYKERLRALLASWGHEVKDFGTHSEESVDYPVYVRPVAEAVARGEYERGIVLGGSGNGEAIVANRVRGVRCTVCWNVESARYARLHNDANVLSLGERGIRQKNVFGGRGFMTGKSAFVIAWGDGLLMKCPRAEYEGALATPGVTPFAPDGERPMSTWVVVPADAIADDPELGEWLARGLRGVR